MQKTTKGWEKSHSVQVERNVDRCCVFYFIQDIGEENVLEPRESNNAMFKTLETQPKEYCEEGPTRQNQGGLR